jgi:ferredoxin-type protein NapH
MAQVERLGAEAIEKKGWWLAYRWLILRRISQIFIIVLFLLGPWAGLWIIKGNLASSLLLDTVPMNDPLMFLQMLAAGFTLPATTAILGAVIVLGFYLLVGGRVYCSWVCPVNIVTDAANWLREKQGIRPGTRLARNTRYWMLAMTLVVSFTTGTLAFELINPVSMLHRGFIFGMGMAWFVVLAVFLFDLFMARRGWCSHLCPIGAFYSLVGTISLIRVRADKREFCDDCNECFKVCPEPQVIIPALKGAEKGIGPVINSGDCTNCGRCIDICAEDVFSFGLRFGNKTETEKPAIALTEQVQKP